LKFRVLHVREILIFKAIVLDAMAKKLLTVQSAVQWIQISP
jgi:hypothetical protein